MAAQATHRRPLTRARQGVRGRSYRSVTGIIRQAALRRSRYEMDDSDPLVVPERDPGASTCEGARASFIPRSRARARVSRVRARVDPVRVAGESRGAGRGRAKRTGTADEWATLAIRALRLPGMAERAQTIRWLQRMSPSSRRRGGALPAAQRLQPGCALAVPTPSHPNFMGSAACALRRRRSKHCREAPGV